MTDASGGPVIDDLDVDCYIVPTDRPESDGTLQWDSTTIVIVRASAGNSTGLGYSYTHSAAANLITGLLADVVIGRNSMAIPECWNAMVAAIRNLGRSGLASTAISAVDVALWDLKACLLEIPLVGLLGGYREAVPVYGSGGFTSYSISELQQQLSSWARQALPSVKMKIGREPDQDIQRVETARKAIGPETGLMVDANGAYSRKQALWFAERFTDYGVSWFEEPVSSDDLDGLRMLRDRAPAGMDVTAGEYGYDHFYFRRMLAAGALDVLQADASRCGGITGFLQAARLAQAYSIPLSSHTAPLLHLQVCCALSDVRHMEYFHDHVRIERMFFDGVPEPVNGLLRPDPSRPGLGIELKEADLTKFKI